MNKLGAINKIAEITVFFWVAKIVATTLGETAGDFISQTLNLGYVVGLLITGVLLIAILVFQVRSTVFHSGLFWAAIVATTTAGTEVSDIMDRTFGLGYVAGSCVLVVGLGLSLAVWYYRKGNLAVVPIADRDTEIMFWIAVIFSNSLGTAFGDALVDFIGLSYMQGALVTSGVIALVLMLHYFTKMNAVFLFWAAFVFTRPFGATFGDFLTKPLEKGGLELGTWQASAVSTALLIVVAWLSTRWRTDRDPARQGS
ncbi:hypothetical protein LAV84_28140 [Rhizobium sp. VS19-DR104.2]|uniref:COG4705 family protein n=1 Tax=unclassified Rhizobium TaxID=2613769 RepID=UPI001C5A84C9|nr:MULTISPECIES: hypothetical protein [unclassified Rhizobium]MBZ5763387.1 hypothetical protein [Rhizobium sp. VS19-DR96]MBZ5769282.1 hypothetical protein [Rhizobium sp. VS19-DR129.2]MBZ5776841.1 hypothetical protein [Rhizobium sp. VS19-DRK62.2]MBZ5787939.1 hypothetical protein [Rhizobium sp. VS19-DR121]MBZ5805420.1 hypothetical protein [Rhizobium sp. VS19-DR181]